MQIFTNFNKIEGLYTACVGFFDGVHKGHRFLIDHLIREARNSGTQAAVITFRNHPQTLLHPEQKFPLINTLDERLENLTTTGIDACFLLDFDDALRNLTAQQFIFNILYKQLHISTLLIGYDHRFGHNRAEGFDDYVRYGQECGMQILPEPVFSDRLNIKYSSSSTRRALEQGDVNLAMQILGQPYKLSGTVTGGHKLGRTIGFPTANIVPNSPLKIVPAGGVYAVFVTLADGNQYQGMLNIGSRPTVDAANTQETLEVNLFNFKGNLYGQPLTIAFIERMRAETKFPSIEALQEQLDRDRESAAHLLSQPYPRR